MGAQKVERVLKGKIEGREYEKGWLEGRECGIKRKMLRWGRRGRT